MCVFASRFTGGQRRLLRERQWGRGVLVLGFFCCFFGFFVFFFFVFCPFRAAPAEYGGSQARGRIGAVAAGLHHSHRNIRSELHLQPTPQLTATPDLGVEI